MAAPKHVQERKMSDCLNSLLDINHYFLEDNGDDEQDTFFDETEEEFDGKFLSL